MRKRAKQKATKKPRTIARSATRTRRKTASVTRPEKIETPYDRIKHLVGVVKDLPADLLTNPKFMEDFGRDSMSSLAIVNKIKKLPPEARKEVQDFVDFIAQRSDILQKKGKLSFNWAGGLKELRDQYTSVELQHKASEWRSES